MRLAVLCLGILLLQGSYSYAQPASPQWQVELDNLDKQIQDLSLKIDSYRHKSLDAEAEAQRVMLSDFAKYSAKIKEAEGYEEKTRTGETQLKLLLDQRRAYIEAHSASPTKPR